MNNFLNIDFLIGKEFLHSKFGLGTVSSIDDNLVTINFSGKESKFIFPLSFSNSTLINAVDDSVKEQITKSISQFNDNANTEKIRKEEEKNQKSQSSSLKAVGGFLSSEAGQRLANLNEGTEFRNIADVMNNIFGWNYKGYFKAFYYLDNCKKYGAWFPKFSKDNRSPGDKTSNWLNIITPDGRYIYMRNEDISKMNSIDRNYPIHFTFGKKPGESYKYNGAYKCTHIDEKLGYVFEKIDLNTLF